MANAAVMHPYPRETVYVLECVPPKSTAGLAYVSVFDSRPYPWQEVRSLAVLFSCDIIAYV